MATTVIQAAQIINSSINKLGYQYQIDTTSNETATQGIEQIGAFSPSQLNKILDQMNLVLIFRNYGLMFDSAEDPTRVFWRDAINNGGGIEDIYHEIIESENGFWAEDFDGLDEDGAKALGGEIASDLVSYKENDIIKKFHTNMSRFRLKMSRTDLEISKVFTAEGVTRYIDTQMANLQWSANYKLMQETISAIVGAVNDRKVVFKEGFNLNTPNGVTTMVEAIRTVADGMHQPTTLYNYMQILQRSSDRDLFLVVTPSVINRIRVRGYANAFNLEEYRDNNRLIILPEGTDFGESPSGQKVHACLVDRRAIVIALRYWRMMPKVIENTDYINFFLNVQFLKGYNEFFNFVAFAGDELDFFNESDDTVNVFLIPGGQPAPDSRIFVNGKQLSSYEYIGTPKDGINFYQIPKNSVVEIFGGLDHVQEPSMIVKGLKYTTSSWSGVDDVLWNASVDQEFLTPLIANSDLTFYGFNE